MSSTKVLSIFLITVSGLSFGEECASGWKGYGNYCYRFSIDELSWDEALLKCEEDGATLASVNDPTTNNNLWRNDDKMDWIGLKTTDDKRKWYWNDGLQFTNTFQWANAEPNLNDVCARLQIDDTIAGRECSYSEFFFICQADFNPGSYNKFGNHWFYFSNKRENYYTASKYCYDDGAYLARKEVVNVLNADNRDSQRQYWLGLSRWYWKDGSEYIWHNFISSESNLDKTGKCYVLHGTQDKWVPRECIESHNYICRKDKGTTTTTTSTTTSPTTTTTELTTSTTTTKQTTTKTSTTTSTTTIKPAIITSPPQPSTTTKITPIETSSSTISAVSENDSVSEFAMHTTSTDHTTVVVSSDEVKGMFDRDSALLYTLIVICALIMVLGVIIIVLVVLSRQRVNKQSDKATLHTDVGDGENQQMAQLPGPSSQSSAQTKTNTTQCGASTAQEQPPAAATASDGFPIYAVPNKKKAAIEKL